MWPQVLLTLNDMIASECIPLDTSRIYFTGLPGDFSVLREHKGVEKSQSGEVGGEIKSSNRQKSRNLRPGGQMQLLDRDTERDSISHVRNSRYSHIASFSNLYSTPLTARMSPSTVSLLDAITIPTTGSKKQL
jgi:hypothetical protein